jgi:hypothetical protein
MSTAWQVPQLTSDRVLQQLLRTHGSLVNENDNPQKLREFRTLVISKLVKFWDDFKDIKIAVGETLAQFARRDDLIGWVRPSPEANMPALADEIARLSKENAELRSQVEKHGSETTINGLTFDQLLALLGSKNLLDYFYNNRLPFGIGNMNDYNDEIKELIVLGLVQHDEQVPSYFELTNAGRLFLNRLEVQMRLSQDTAPSA